MRNLSVLIKPASHQCNINCRYCFYKDEMKLLRHTPEQRMRIETLETLVKRAFEFADGSISFVFQGGEPTLMGLPFYETFFKLVQRYNTSRAQVSCSIQTNGILLDDAWCRFLSKNHVLVGLSYDGTAEVNDRNRIDYRGTGTSDRVICAIRKLQQYGVEYNILAVITHQSVPNASKIYKELKQLGVGYLQIIPVLEPIGSMRGTQPYSLSNEELAGFLCELFDLWYADFVQGNALCVTYFENIVYKMMGNPLYQCSMNGSCMIEMVTEANGDVYPCDFYVGDEWKLGNIQTDSFLTMLRGER
ncbi:MAG: radical SAM protein, partial [Clostridia bacterium]|nr:radical SAM protein [Clostridia bacterium]